MMAKVWNFIFFQVGWFACVLGAANGQAFWAVLATLLYVLIHVWQSEDKKAEGILLFKVFILGVSADSLIMNMGFLGFNDVWPSQYLSPAWMWALWVLVASTMNGSLSWLKGKPILGAALGAIAGPLSYEAGMKLGAGDWGSGHQWIGIALVSAVWALAIPLFLYWNKTTSNRALNKNL